MSRKQWQGLIPIARRFLFGAKEPKATQDLPEGTTSLTTSTNYESMDQDYKWFRKDRLVRRCILVNAFFSTLSSGFETQIQTTDQTLTEAEQEALVKEHEELKAWIDDINTVLNMDNVLFVTQIKRSIFGRAGWEIVLDNEGKYPAWLLSLRSEKLRPKQNQRTLELQGFTYGNVKKLKYLPEEVFYITNLQLEHDYEGLSDVEPIREICNARNEIIWENFPEIVRTLWAPFNVASADTSGMADSAETSFLQNLAQKMRAGKSLATNRSVTVTAVALSADIVGLTNLIQSLKEEIIGNFGTPRFLLGQPIENRATAYAEFEAYIEGPITAIQVELGRVMEAWYRGLSEKWFTENGKNYEEKAPVEIKHVWQPQRTTDIETAATAAAALWGQGGMGPLGLRQDFKKVWEIMQWDPRDLEEEPSGDDVPGDGEESDNLGP